MLRLTACLAFSVVLVASCESKNEPLVSADPYVPSIATTDSSGTSYRFSESQLERMKNTRLNRELFLRYIESEWPSDRLATYCSPKNRWPNYQNLVPDGLLFGSREIPVHSGKSADFDKLFVYVTEDDATGNYQGEAGTKWKRWNYSLNVSRGTDRWVIIEALPNDLVDHPEKYLRR